MKNTLKIGLIVLLILISATTLFARARFDIGVDAPVVIGIFDSEYGVSAMPVPMLIPIPDMGLYHIVSSENAATTIGIGARITTYLVATAAIPNMFFETTKGDTIYNFQVGGGLVAAGGMMMMPIIMPIPLIMVDYSIAKKVNKWFNWGGGIAAAGGIATGDGYYDSYITGGAAFALYAFCKWNINF